MILGNKGDGILFDVNGLHLGGRVSQGERVAIVFNLQPCLFPSRKSAFHKLTRIGGWEFDVFPPFF